MCPCALYTRRKQSSCEPFQPKPDTSRAKGCLYAGALAYHSTHYCTSLDSKKYGKNTGREWEKPGNHYSHYSRTCVKRHEAIGMGELSSLERSHLGLKCCRHLLQTMDRQMIGDA